MTTPEQQQQQPENIIGDVIRASGVIQSAPGAVRSTQLTAQIMAALERAGYEITDGSISGADLTEGAGPDDTCGCGEPITLYEGEWLHIFNPELRGTDDHEASP